MFVPAQSPARMPSASRPPGVPTVLVVHVAVTLLYSILFANTAWLMPLLVRLQFGAADPHWRDWQTTLVTAAVPTLMMTSIFWGELLARLKLRTYLLAFWTTAALPLGMMALAQNYAQFYLCHLAACVGIASWNPLSGRLLKHFYPDAIRGRAYGALTAAALLGGVAAAYAFGAWMERDPRAFRGFLPAAAGLQLVGIALLARLARLAGADSPPADAVRFPTLKSLLAPVRNMGAVLRSDRTFARYEIAFMTYGGAYMFCDAILPVLATDRLDMRYQDFAWSTQVVARLATLLAMLPMGWLQDRVGAVRVSGLAFAGLATYPLMLWLARGTQGVAAASAVWGVAMAGVLLGWMLGPVSLARRPEQVPQYVAIHATLVGVRGVCFQGLGMLLYKLTGSFAWPLAAASVAFAWAAVLMWRLHRDTPTIRATPAAR